MEELPPLSARGSERSACVAGTPAATPRDSHAGAPPPTPPAAGRTGKSWGKGGGVEELIRGLLCGSESELRRVWQRHGARGGRLPASLASQGIVSRLALNVGDAPHVARFVDAAAGPDGCLSIQELLRSVQRPVEVDRDRFRAPGIIPEAIQRCTTGSVRTPLGYEYNGPPFAVQTDADQVTTLIEQSQQQRRNKMETTLKKFSKDERKEWLSHREFVQALGELDRFQVPDYEQKALIIALDPRMRDKIKIEKFIALFGTEYLKNKSNRATVGGDGFDGNSNTLQWPSSIVDRYDRKQVMQDLRQRQAPKLKIHTNASAQHRIACQQRRKEQMLSGEDPTASARRSRPAPPPRLHAGLTPRPPPPRHAAE